MKRQISIITINFNNSLGLRKTLESVTTQDCVDFEYIVIDGGSQDESIEILKQYQEKISICISEPDKGIYDAMNKGIQQSKGEFLLFINSGDVLVDNQVVSSILNSLKDDVDIASGILKLNDHGKTTLLFPPGELTIYQAIYDHLLHPCTLIHKRLFDKYGCYDTNNRIVSDWAFFLNVTGLNSCRYQKLDFLIAEFHTDGISSTNKALVEEETNQVLHSVVPESILVSIRRLRELEQKSSQIEYRLLEKSTIVRSFLTILSKIYRKLNLI